MWWYIASAALQATAADKQNSEQSNAYKSGKFQAEQLNQTKAFRNLKGAADASLANYARSVNNQRVMDASGKNLENSQVNYMRQRDDLMSGKLMLSLRAAEEAGTTHVTQALNNQSGSTVDMLNSVSNIRHSMAVADIAKQDKQLNESQSIQAANIMRNMVNSLDTQQTIAAMDYSMEKNRQQRPGNLGLDLLAIGLDTYSQIDGYQAGIKAKRQAAAERLSSSMIGGNP